MKKKLFLIKFRRKTQPIFITMTKNVFFFWNLKYIYLKVLNCSKCFFFCSLYVKEKSSGIEHVLGPIICDTNFEKERGSYPYWRPSPIWKPVKLPPFRKTLTSWPWVLKISTNPNSTKKYRYQRILWDKKVIDCSTQQTHTSYFL